MGPPPLGVRRLALPALLLLAAWPQPRAGRAAEMYDSTHCEERGAKELVRPMEPFICTRAGNLNGIRLKDECENALRNIVDGPGSMVAQRPQPISANTFCRPGRDVNIVKSEFTCYCTDRRQWDCHKGATPEKPMPGSRKASSAPRQRVPRKCDADIIIHKMYTDFCDMYGMYVTYDDCLTPRNHTITVQNWVQRDTPVVCLPGSYTIYMRCQLCRCLGGVFQQDCEFVDCPWTSS
ncbi:Envelope protein UL45-like protein [Frankliniella fusca]|uniref:Envelope protein UL45-like protein n=1 Tax=Frankliniella fusca TaxID=407009 RepID=A0AAE1HZH1_9NEOP|nr:Envelope protein UL45-like protein [Frankliniella fusca]